MTGGVADPRVGAIAYLTGAEDGRARPSAVGKKFEPDGRVLRYPGNTFICHVPAESEAHRALVAAQAALRAGPQGDAFAFLPPASFHMTVFEGVTDLARSDGRWPQDMHAEAPVAEVTDTFAARAAQLDLPSRRAIRPTGLFAGFSLRVEGATPEEEAGLRASREKLSALTGIRRPDFAGYGFHITLAYLLRWLTSDEAGAVVDLSEQVFARLVQEAPTIALGPVEFCTFDDMHAFRPILRIGSARVDRALQ